MGLFGQTHLQSWLPKRPEGLVMVLCICACMRIAEGSCSRHFRYQSTHLFPSNFAGMNKVWARSTLSPEVLFQYCLGLARAARTLPSQKVAKLRTARTHRRSFGCATVDANDLLHVRCMKGREQCADSMVLVVRIRSLLIIYTRRPAVYGFKIIRQNLLFSCQTCHRQP